MLTKSKTCRYGRFTYFVDDIWVGRALDVYQEYSEGELNAFRTLLRSGDDVDWSDSCVVCGGANIGMLAIPLAQHIGPKGKIYAFEPRPDAYEVLVKNIVDNKVEGIIEPHMLALGNGNGVLKMKLHDHVRGYEADDAGEYVVPMMTLDSFFDLHHIKRKVAMLQMDVEGTEQLVLEGAQDMIARDRPIVYCENDRPEKAEDLIRWLTDHRYRMWWHRPTLYNPNNFAGIKRNVFGNIVSLNMLCLREETNYQVGELDEVVDYKIGPDMYDREIARYQRIVDQHPEDCSARAWLAYFHSIMRHDAESWQQIDAALAFDPDHAEVLHLKHLKELQTGSFDWSKYQHRFKLKKNTWLWGNRPHEGVEWDGSPTDEPVLIWNEQGFGDTIQFARFLPEAIARAPNAFFEVQAQLYEIMCYSFPGIKIYRYGRELPKYSKHCSVASLPYVMDVGANVSRPPYLKIDPVMLQFWANRPYPKIGICMAGSRKSERPFTRDMPDEDMKHLLWNIEVPLQVGNNMGLYYNFAETAAALLNLELVLSVDTATAHLAGALGVPVWLLLSYDPDFRWGLTGDRTHWYDSVRIFRQTSFMNWQSVVDQVHPELIKYTSSYREAAE